MSLEELKKRDDIVKVADTYGVDLSETKNNEQRLQALRDDGVDDEMVKQALKKDEEPEEVEKEQKLISSETVKPKFEDTEEQLPDEAKKAKNAQKKHDAIDSDVSLIKMTRNNPAYEIRGYKFTRANPYVLVNNADVDFLCEVEGGFAVAKPSEVESFYS